MSSLPLGVRTIMRTRRSVLVRTGCDQAMMTECNGLLESKHCSRDGISTDKSSPVGQLVHEFQIELQRFGHHDGGPRHYADAHHDSALGAAVFAEFEKRWSRYARPVGGSWRMDETY